MSLIEKVASLQELEKKATQSDPADDAFDEPFQAGDSWKYEVMHSYFDKYGMRNYLDFGEFDTKNDADYYATWRNAAPDLLEVLAGFQEGDAKRIEQFFRMDMCPDSEYPPECCMCDEHTQNICDILKRYQEMARLMEASRK